MGFIFNQQSGETPETIKRKRDISQALLQQGMDGSPIQHPLQGVNRILAAVLGRVNASQADRAERSLADRKEADRKASSDKFSSVMGALFSPQQQTSSVAPQASPEKTGGGGAPTPQGAAIAEALMKDFGLSQGAAAGFAGNLAHESGDFKTLQEVNPLVPGSRGGFGWAQWTGPRRRAFEAWAAQNNLDPASPEANYGFLKHELQNTPEGAVLEKLQGVDDPARAAQIVSETFLRPGIPHMDNRIRFAQQIAQGMGGGAGQQATVQPASFAAGAGAQMPQDRQQAAAPGQQASVQQVSGLPMQQIFDLISDPNLNEQQASILSQVVKNKMASGEWTRLNDGTLFNSATGETRKFELPQKPQDMMNVSAGNTVFDPNTQKPIFTAPQQEKPQAKPSAIQEYEYAKSQGFPGTFQDWEASKKGGMSLQVDPATGQVTFQQGSNIKPMTEAQSKDTVFATRAAGALERLDPVAGALTDFPDRLKSGVPVVGNMMVSEKYQLAAQAGKEFLQAILRKDTGAAITKEETAEYGTVYLPQPGDSAETLAQKALSRKRAVAAIEAGMPPQAILAQEKALILSGSGLDGSPTQSQKAAPQPGEPSLEDLLKKYGD